MRNWKKLVLPGLILLPVFLALPSCQTTSAADSSVIEEVAEETGLTHCEGMKPPTYTQEQFNALHPAAVDMLVLWDALWADVCE